MHWFAISFVALFAGCGTIQNLSRGVAYDPAKSPMYPYGGVDINNAEMANGMRVLRRLPPEPAAVPATGKVLKHAVDTPFTLVGDTITYPYCYLSGIARYYNRHFYEEEQARIDPNFENYDERFRREHAVPDLEITSPPEPASSTSPPGPAPDPRHSAR